jgi:hypothetical protein
MMSTAGMSWDQVCRRAAGRKRFNAWRQRRAVERRFLVMKLLEELGGSHGVQARIAKILGVARSTITADLQRIHAEARGEVDEHGRPPRKSPALDLESALAHYRAAMACGPKAGVVEVAELTGRMAAKEEQETPATPAELRDRLERLRRLMGLPK